jgi:L-galactose dehydrogenase
VHGGGLCGCFGFPVPDGAVDRFVFIDGNVSPLAMGALTGRGAPPWHPAAPQVLARCGRAAHACRERGSDLAKILLQFAVATSPCVTTVIGSANAANVRRNAAWIGEPLDEDLLSDIDAILAPVRDQGWINGRPENQDPGRPS